VTITEGVTSIGSEAFRNCGGLTCVTIPASVTSIGDLTFANCNGLTALVVDSGNNYYSSVDGVLFNADQTHLVQWPAAKSEEYTIPEGVTSIGASAFCDCDRLVSVTIPSSVTDIGDEAFRDCSGLTNVTITEGVTSIGTSAFSGCGELKSLAVPGTVTSIGNGAFEFCWGLTRVDIHEGVTGIGGIAFLFCVRLTSVTIPSSVTSIGDGAFGFCVGLESVIFAGDAPAMGGSVFSLTARGFTVYYLTGTTGFDSPEWEPYPGDAYQAVMLDEMPSSSGIWLLTHDLPHDTDLNQDLNGDGVDLLMAYALVLDPHNALAGMPVPILGPGTLSMTFHGAAQGVTYGAETSTDLQNWGSDGVTLSAPDPDGMRTATIDTTAPRRFMRLVVAEE
jgi:hypothetical protein